MKLLASETHRMDLRDLLTRSAGALSAAPAEEGRSVDCTEAVADAKVMIVDDEPLTIEVLRGHLEENGYSRIVEIDSAVDALLRIILEQPDVVLLDLHMPHIHGLDILREIRRDHRVARTPVMVLTASSDPDERLLALELGATDFLQKPVQPAELHARLRNTLMAKAYQDYLEDQSEALERAVRHRTAELEASRRDVIHCLARAAEYRDDDTGQHVVRVGRYARIIGAEFGLDERAADVLEQAAQLHDIGKIGIPDAILLKPGKLTSEEFEFIQKHCGIGKRVVMPLTEQENLLQRQHVEVGARILEGGSSDVLVVAQRVALTHHERWDGTGYPLGLAGEDIPLEGRITAVADVFDALSSKRPYKPPFPIDKCFAIMEESRGTQFDPRVLDAFMRRRAEIVRTQIDCAECG